MKDKADLISTVLSSGEIRKWNMSDDEGIVDIYNKDNKTYIIVNSEDTCMPNEEDLSDNQGLNHIGEFYRLDIKGRPIVQLISINEEETQHTFILIWRKMEKPELLAEVLSGTELARIHICSCDNIGECDDGIAGGCEGYKIDGDTLITWFNKGCHCMYPNFKDNTIFRVCYNNEKYLYCKDFKLIGKTRHYTIILWRNNMYISKGNIRMTIPIWSLPAEKTCPNCTPHCSRYCYAKKAERVYKAVLPSRERNLVATKQNDFIKKITAKIIKLKGLYFRVHESGDMYDQKYLDKWIETCSLVPEKNFLVFSQMWDLDWSEKPDNMIVYCSIWDDTQNAPHDEHRAFVIDDGSGKIGKNQLHRKVKICVKGKGVELKCEDCLHCYKGEGDVAFKIH